MCVCVSVSVSVSVCVSVSECVFEQGPGSVLHFLYTTDNVLPHRTIQNAHLPYAYPRMDLTRLLRLALLSVAVVVTLPSKAGDTFVDAEPTPPL